MYFVSVVSILCWSFGDLIASRHSFSSSVRSLLVVFRFLMMYASVSSFRPRVSASSSCSSFSSFVIGLSFVVMMRSRSLSLIVMYGRVWSFCSL